MIDDDDDDDNHYNKNPCMFLDNTQYQSYIRNVADGSKSGIFLTAPLVLFH